MTRGLNKKCTSDDGAIIIIVLLLTTVILMFASMVIDLTTYEDSREQSEYFARKAALAAVDAHLRSDPSLTFAQKAAVALARAREVAGKNFMLSDYDRAMTAQFGGSGAVLTPGIYYFTKPANSDPLNGKYPGFDPKVADNNSDPGITAYRVTGSLYDSVSTRLARSLFGVDKFPINVKAIASVFPRQGCFLVDISGSMTQETNKRQTVAQQTSNPDLGRGRFFSFTTQADNNFSPPSAFQDPYWDFLVNNTPNRPVLTPRSTSVAQWNAFLSPADISAINPEEEYQQIHFASDYRLMRTLGDADYGSLNQNIQKHHPSPTDFPAFNPFVTRVDVNRINGQDTAFPSYSYNGAEPLRTVFAGLKSAMQFFKDRQVAGDAACLIFYDRSISWYRYVRMTNDFDYLLALTDFDNITSITGNDPANRPGYALNRVNRGAVGFERIVRHGMIPLGPRSGFTNTFLALTTAMTEIQQGNPSGASVSNFITLIGDGLSNCRRCTGQACNGNQFTCANWFDNYSAAQSELLEWVKTNLQNRNIPLHWILVGQTVLPHTLGLMDPANPGQCLTDAGARLYQGPNGSRPIPFVQGGFGHLDSNGQYQSDLNGDPCTFACTLPITDQTRCDQCRNAFSNMSQQTPFLEANVIPYELAAATKGLWGPIRKLRNCVPVNPQTDCTRPALLSDGTPNWQNARVFTNDPECRDETTQMNDYMAEIIGGNPIALVEVQ